MVMIAEYDIPENMLQKSINDVLRRLGKTDDDIITIKIFPYYKNVNSLTNTAGLTTVRVRYYHVLIFLREKSKEVRT